MIKRLLVVIMIAFAFVVYFIAYVLRPITYILFDDSNWLINKIESIIIKYIKHKL